MTRDARAPRRAAAPETIEALAAAPPLPREFYARAVLRVARACVGKVLVRRTEEGIVAGRIVETEAYRGPDDLAAHSAGGRRTARTEAMFGVAGHAYMFLLYGMHWAFNIVAGAEGDPHAVLVRAVEPIAGLELMSLRRGVPLGFGAEGALRRPGAPNVERARVELTNGPGKVCRAFGLDRGAYGMDLCGGALYLVDGAAGPVGRSPRINVDYAGAWAQRPWRFYERGNRYVSVPPRD